MSNGTATGLIKAGPSEERNLELQQTSSTDVVRTTIVIPRELDLNLEVVRIKRGGISKNDLIKVTLAKLIVEEGLDPSRPPKTLSVSY